MDLYKVELFPKAYRDLDQLFEYISVELGSVYNAKNQTDRIFRAITSLNMFPYRHPELTAGRYAGKNYHQMVVDHYLVIYRIDEKAHTVFVITVEYMGRAN